MLQRYRFAGEMIRNYLLQNKQGGVLLEYTLIISLISIIAITTMTTLGRDVVRATFNQVVDAITP